ncbi:helix-turn-helix transcriptional regulator [uncultured Pelagimonas sp.]|uniref:helix-turn-helix domain-containing protein n=1 Tax=uncultured Pelagimonas sp. TaxID=1618102 RepID=UPI0034450BD9
MAQIHDKIEKIYRQRGLSTRQAAKTCGINYTTFRSMLQNEREVSASTLDTISSAFDIPFSYFSAKTPIIEIESPKNSDSITSALSENADSALHRVGIQTAKAGDVVTLESFLNWWVASAGRLENFDKIAHRVDLFERPPSDANQIQPLQIGQSSLASKYFYLEETGHLKQTLDGFSPETNTALVQAHIEACNRGEPVISHPFLDETLRTGERFARRYRRIIAPLYLGGKTLLANYSEDIL